MTTEAAEKKENVWQLAPRPVKIAIIIVFILLLMWAAANIYRILRKPPNAHYIKGGGDVPDTWSPTALTDSLYHMISGIDLGISDEAMHEFNGLNDNQMISVYNDWNNRYATKSIFLGMGSYGTLTNSLNGESFLIGSNALREAAIMLSNLKRLQLT